MYSHILMSKCEHFPVIMNIYVWIICKEYSDFCANRSYVKCFKVRHIILKNQRYVTLKPVLSASIL